MLDRPIKAIGVHEVKVALHPEVAVTVKVNVARSPEEAELQAQGIDVMAQMFERDAAPASPRSSTPNCRAADEAPAEEADAESSGRSRAGTGRRRPKRAEGSSRADEGEQAEALRRPSLSQIEAAGRTIGGPFSLRQAGSSQSSVRGAERLAPRPWFCSSRASGGRCEEYRAWLKNATTEQFDKQRDRSGKQQPTASRASSRRPAQQSQQQPTGQQGQSSSGQTELGQATRHADGSEPDAASRAQAPSGRLSGAGAGGSGGFVGSQGSGSERLSAGAAARLERRVRRRQGRATPIRAALDDEDDRDRPVAETRLRHRRRSSG